MASLVDKKKTRAAVICSKCHNIAPLNREINRTAPHGNCTRPQDYTVPSTDPKFHFVGTDLVDGPEPTWLAA